MATKSVSPNPESNSSKRNGSAPVVRGDVRKTPRILAGSLQHMEDAARKNTLVLYEKAIRLMHAGKYSEAHAAFGAMLATAPPDFGDRIRMYIATCVGQIHEGTTDFQTHEERYDYAISLLNHGNYEDAREHLQEILMKEKSADYAFYGLALLASMTGDSEKCIEHLTEAIRLNAQNRLQARLDSDFDGVSDDPRFTDLLYPES